MARLVAISIGVLSVLLGLLFVSLSFATDHWIEYVVQRDHIQNNPAVSNTSFWTNPIYFSRNRGLFRTCFLGLDVDWLTDPKYEDRLVDGVCLYETGYELTQNQDTINYGSHYDIRKHLMRAHVGFQIFAMLASLVSIFVAVSGCWTSRYKTVRYGGLGCFFSAFFQAGAMACCHGYDFLEREEINILEFRRYWMNNPPLEGFAGYSFGYSYICGWVGTGLFVIATIVLFFTANNMQDDMEDDIYQKESLPGSEYPYGSYPVPYDHNDMPMVYPPTYDYSTYGGGAYVVAPSMMEPQAIPAIEYAPSGMGTAYPY